MDNKVFDPDIKVTSTVGSTLRKTLSTRSVLLAPTANAPHARLQLIGHADQTEK